MLPTLFPYTYLNESRYRLLRAVFGVLAVYQPAENQVPETMARRAAEGGLALRIPLRGREDELARCITEYTAWAAQHQGGQGLDSQFFRHSERRVPLVDDSAVTRLKSAIRGGAAADAGDPGGQQGVSGADRQFQARLFLAMAQEYDQRQWALMDDLAALKSQERRLMDNLKGLSPSAAPRSPAFPAEHAPDSYQIESRLRAWLQLWAADAEIAAHPPLLVTTRPEIVEALRPEVPDLTQVTVLDRLPFPGDDRETSGLLLDWLERSAASASSAAADWPAPPQALFTVENSLPVRLEIYAAPHHSWIQLGEGAAAGGGERHAARASAPGAATPEHQGILALVLALAEDDTASR